ncbi:guanylate cyclase [Photobacterium gaetbulicola]|uniref:Heme NO binding, putative n=1 Tax=Photobacterium gaetbulicola Gung47 TaxID=658445 RepID=A0A0C5W9W1_9GAMM|nr:MULTISPECIES: heme NO-binding domain-containing protein [Photobacterium]AJR08336.1 heme NO binding, putative [Photobacterium gaetbulicola Gung47]PSU08990.1 guanylate cyclase [Photobacterium gaetbulicola]WEM43567.1 heme NO-binding domain-containing protein [Photobacterium sp. DA100]
MKGIIFTEFLDIVESRFGLDVCQQMLDDAGVDGAYTAVGSYDHRVLVKMIVCLSKITGVSPEVLQEAYGEALFTRLLSSFPLDNGEKPNSTFSFIERVERHIHTEVKKLYANANPPQFDFISQTSALMILDYISARCLSHVCLGLIRGCVKHFNEDMAISMEPVNQDQSHVRFTLKLNAG